MCRLEQKASHKISKSSLHKYENMTNYSNLCHRARVPYIIGKLQSKMVKTGNNPLSHVASLDGHLSYVLYEHVRRGMYANGQRSLHDLFIPCL